MRLLPLLLAAAYGLPDPGKIPPPDPPRKARIERALETIRTGDGPELDVAVRDLALCGEVALPAIVARLNEAGAGERLLLLAAASPNPLAAPLLDQAREDPHPAVRAWARGAPREKDPSLRDLAGRYLDLLAVAEQRLYGKADDDLKPLGDPLGRRPGTVDVQRRRMKDDEVAKAVRRERERAATRFALAGAGALARGELRPHLDDAVFVAYTGLLREEGDASYFATVALVAAGEATLPALEDLFERESQDPKKIARILCAIRPDRGHGVLLSFDRRRPEAQRALIDLAPEVLEGAELQMILEGAAVAEDGSVRTAALDALLELPPPAGRDPARTLLDPERYGPAEFKRAAELLARAGDLEQLGLFASLPPVPAGPGGETQALSNLRAAAQTALRGASGDAVEAMGRRFLGAEAKGVRTLGLDLVRDRETLLAFARAEPVDDLARAALLRVLSLHADAADEALAILSARGLPADTPFVQRLVAMGRTDLLVGLAAKEGAALRALGDLERVDARFEEALLAIYDGAPATRRRDALCALVAAGTEAARQRCEANPDLALDVLRQRAEVGFRSAFPFPLRRFLAGADGQGLRTLAGAAEGVPSPEPGIFLDIFRAWGEVEGPGTEEGPTQEKARLFDGLTRAGDRTSAKMFLDLLVAGETKEPALAMGTLMAAARLLDASELARLLPLLREQVKAERPRDGKQPPPWSALREVLLRGGFNALGYAKVDAALDDLSDFVLDPLLQPAAFDGKDESSVPYWALDALRDYPIASVEPAFRRALVRAEEEGRLAACEPAAFLGTPGRRGYIRACRDWPQRGRSLYEVALALCDAFGRMPGCDLAYDRMIALGGLGRYAEAAAAARVAATRRRAAGFTALDGLPTPEYLETRARLYEALAARDPTAIAVAVEAERDPFVRNVAAWYLRFEVVDLALAARTAEEAVRSSAGLHRTYRDTLASVRNAEGRPGEALRLLDPLERVPAKRQQGSLWHEAFFADAYLQRGEETEARNALERAADDRRVLPHIRSDPKFARFPDVFRSADERFFYDLLFNRDLGE